MRSKTFHILLHCHFIATATGTTGSSPTTRFAALGEFGTHSAAEVSVEAMLMAQSPDFIMTAGDNRYDAITYQQAVGDYYGQFLPVVSGGTSPTNRFFPAPGNHDYDDGGSSETIDRQISQSSYDAEEQLSSGSVNLTSSDIELGTDSSTFGEQTAGLRFQNLTIPQGAIVTAAYIDFECDEADSVATSVTIQAENSDDALTFSTAANDITNRPKTAASVDWSPGPWTVDSRYQTPDLSALIQKVINRPGWTSGNNMAFIIDGSGERTAEAIDGEAAAAAKLHLEFEEAPVAEIITI